MPGTIVHVGATILCPHGAPVQVVPGSPRATLTGMPAATMADQFLVTGCPFVLPGGAPSPCVRVQWLVPAVRVVVNGAPAILNTSVGLCLSAAQVPQGPPIVVSTQPRGVAT
jgi:uncharacterized Zn-binding protein involved in type VI secretion